MSKKIENMTKVPAKSTNIGNKIKHIVDRYDAGETAQAIADDLGYTRQYITKIVNKYGTPRGKGRSSTLKITLHEILRRSNDGETSIAIAKDAGCTPSNIRRLLKEHKKTTTKQFIKKPNYNTDFDDIHDYLIKSLEKDYPEQLETMKKSIDTFDYEFLCFADTYYYLSRLIPTNRTIYDMGCCWGFQAYFFRNHKKYIGVDSFIESQEKQLKLPNTEYYNTTIEDFLNKNKVAKRHFAICNYVPPWGADNEELVRKHFKHLHIYYP